MFCANCGSALDPANRFCTACGSAFTADPGPASGAAPAPAPPMAAPPPPAAQLPPVQPIASAGQSPAIGALFDFAFTQSIARNVKTIYLWVCVAAGIVVFAGLVAGLQAGGSLVLFAFVGAPALFLFLIAMARTVLEILAVVAELRPRSTAQPQQ